jgi:hypothetical protein
VTKTELAAEIEKWFDATTGRQRQWIGDPVGVVIKERLERVGHWKRLPRGNPAKGRAIALKQKV